MLAGLLLVWDFLFNNPQVAALTTCVLAVVIALAMSPERPARPAAEELVRALVGERASSEPDSDDRSEGLVQRMWLCVSHDPFVLDISLQYEGECMLT